MKPPFNQAGLVGVTYTHVAPGFAGGGAYEYEETLLMVVDRPPRQQLRLNISRRRLADGGRWSTRYLNVHIWVHDARGWFPTSKVTTFRATELAQLRKAMDAFDVEMRTLGDAGLDPDDVDEPPARPIARPRTANRPPTSPIRQQLIAAGVLTEGRAPTPDNDGQAVINE